MTQLEEVGQDVALSYVEVTLKSGTVVVFEASSVKMQTSGLGQRTFSWEAETTPSRRLVFLDPDEVASVVVVDAEL
jgi:hypothetical protein